VDPIRHSVIAQSGVAAKNTADGRALERPIGLRFGQKIPAVAVRPIGYASDEVRMAVDESGQHGRVAEIQLLSGCGRQLQDGSCDRQPPLGPKCRGRVLPAASVAKN
jgi:hypothetical protein